MLKSLFQYILTVVAAAYFGLLVHVLVGLPLGFLPNPTLTDVLSCIACVAGSMGLLFARFMKYGYDENTPDSPLLNWSIVVQSLAAVGLYILVTVLLGYGTAGAATNVAVLAPILAKAIADVDIGGMIAQMATEYGGWMFLSLGIQTVPFVPAMLLGYVVGGKRRQKSRRELLGNHK